VCSSDLGESVVYIDALSYYPKLPKFRHSMKVRLNTNDLGQILNNTYVDI